MEYCSRMYKLYSKISPHEQIVGWFSTFPHLDSVLLTLHQVLASKYYKAAETPFIYLALNPAIKENKKILIKVLYLLPDSNASTIQIDIQHSISVYDFPLSLLLHRAFSRNNQGQ